MVYVLFDDNFKLVLSSSGKKLLCTEINNISLILFYAHDSANSKSLIELFRVLDEQLEGNDLSLGMCNLRRCTATLKLSRESTTVFASVPYILCYVNGKPFKKYEGEQSVRELSKFIQQVHSDVARFKNGQTTLQKDEAVEELPTSGIPCNRAQRRNLTMEEAYESSKSGPSKMKKKIGGFQTYSDAYGEELSGDGMNGGRM